jgi:hypothetical protein
MNSEKYVKRELLYYKILVLIGVIAAVVGFIFRYQENAMYGIAFGCLSGGGGSLLAHKYLSKRPELKKNAELQYEERNIFINTKAGQTAFWISYLYITIASIFNYAFEISLKQFLIVTVFFMPIVYFSTLYIYHKKY